ncbi:MAG: hypothetical protein RMJ53_08865 [Chitinophagales bacterium]|nr:hypothetical protein [Chitinophagales bacterium]MDW8274323.1 hypothetical protein [Chitinophagales bacterium]
MLKELVKNTFFRYFTEETTQHLPHAIKKNLHVTGFMDKPVPFNAEVFWKESWLKLSPKNNWTRLQTLQFNSVEPIGRVSYMKFSSMPISARDLYWKGYGEVKGKLLNIFNIIFDNSRETAISSLIKVFCEFLFIPGYVLSSHVKWEHINDCLVKATLFDCGIEVTGWFYFDSNGLFNRFETEDRYFTIKKDEYKKVKFSAIAESYTCQDDLKVCNKVKSSGIYLKATLNIIKE